MVFAQCRSSPGVPWIGVTCPAGSPSQVQWSDEMGQTSTGSRGRVMFFQGIPAGSILRWHVDPRWVNGPELLVSAVLMLDPKGNQMNQLALFLDLG